MLKSLLFILGLLAATGSLSAQQISPSTPPPPPPPEAPKAPAAQPIDPSTPPPPPPEEPAKPPVPLFDPYHAEKSIEIGTFYMKRGKYDAAISRFLEASHYQPGLAEPWRLMGEAYEKKHANAKAVTAYKKYLELFPGAKDAKKVNQRISRLEEKIDKKSSKDSAH